MLLVRGREYLAQYPNFTLVGREHDLERISSILIRKSSNSLLLTGPAGVGVSMLTLGLQAIKSSPDTPFDLIVKKLFWLNCDALFSSGDSAKINNEFQSILKKLKQTPESVLIITDTANFLEGAHNTGNAHFINALNNADKSSNFQVILEVRDDKLSSVLKASTKMPELYTLYDVKEPVGDDLKAIVSVVAKDLSEHHKIQITEDAIDEAIHLTSKYRDSLGLGGAQPQRAISLLDRALASYRQLTHKQHPKIVELMDKIAKSTNEVEQQDLQQQLEQWQKDWQELKSEINKTYQYQRDAETLRFQLQDEITQLQEEEDNSNNSQPTTIKTFAQFTAGGFDSPAVAKLKEKIRQIDTEIAQNNNQHQKLVMLANKDLRLNRQEVITEFSKVSGIPANKLDENEVENLINLEANLLSRIFGQDSIVKHVANSVKVAKVDELEESGPAMSYLFLGPSGVGKTEMAKALAKYVYGDEKSLVRFDMSEYMEKHAVAKLIGAPPGYEGFEAGGILTNSVRAKPVGIYLFDEIEKAHPDVFNIFLQILSDGRLTDNVGRTVDFSDIMIIMTSNIGQPYYLDPNLTDEEARGLATNELNNTYRSELLNRFNGRENILHFKRLPMEVIEQIICREINKLNQAYQHRGFTIEISDSSISAFCHDHYDLIRGARGLPGYIKTNIRPFIVNHILQNPNDKGIFSAVYNQQTHSFDMTFCKI
ncbi:AAA domain-containing protein [Gilliamella sp. Pra-s65]|uniref:AAA family ATPase n=1 Tax=unclassified Gilliamella TaxID=2685620 RepID=UPI001327212F|nr:MULTISPECIES: AAA family ATPase [unclassified Gilliamella]MWN31877.1 AAA domain-containing protein [Gilliamella sp. Pra-s60]MWN90142.1 AAA domain-containing protein [Gilliamella sp. Pra-s65]MWP29201.1 AAA domain-containing protein [Gilliamella sp. Pra-s54]MWP47904.1 AAA domain-containing protein [Gilliamella sp. Pas-s27]MWP73175.1 AAA domain-containing protein [Gilliamella sp. Pra-s52]